MPTVISIENISKSYRLGAIGGGTLREDLSNWWTKFNSPTGKEKKSFADEFWALKNINFEIMEGEILGIVGRNGAGKSTLLKILSRVTAPTSGHVKIRGRIASLLEVGTGFHPELSGRDNIFLNGAILGMTKEEIYRKFDEIVSFSEISEFIDTPVKRYSSGMYVRLAFAVAAHLESEILIVDEVLAVGDAEFQKKCLGKIGDITQHENRTVIFVSHNMDAVRKLCSTGVHIKNGQVQLHGAVNPVVDDYLFGSNSDASSMVFHYPERPLSEFQIKKIEILNEDGSPKNNLRTWDSVRFRVTFHSPRPLKNGAINFHISTPSGTRLVVASNYPDQCHTIHFKEGINTADCIFSKLMLSSGKYLIGASLAVPNIECLFDGVDHALFEVEGKDVFHSGYSPNSDRAWIPMECRWENGS
ncbi:MAG: ABC transporter ATP-binding protein [Verrucomicrobiota bacterium]